MPSQYRLGVLGFLSPNATGLGSNLALGDVINSLAFVRSSISYFGGDPSRVTVAGHSSGAHLIRALLVSPPAEDLFQ